jgi:hypothetical protein
MGVKNKAFGRLKVHVTDSDIAKAKQNDSMMCVVAQAIARTFPDARRISVDIQSIRWSDVQGRHTYLTPYAVQGYIVAFDAGDDINPFSFSLDSRKAIPVQRNIKTEAGTALSKARSQVRRAKERQLTIEDAVTKDQQSPQPRMTPAAAKSAQTVAAQRTIDAETELVSTKAAYEGQVQNRREGEGHASPPPRVYKGARSREYGMRKLRINHPVA